VGEAVRKADGSGLGRPRRNGALLFRQAGPAGAVWWRSKRITWSCLNAVIVASSTHEERQRATSGMSLRTSSRLLPRTRDLAVE